MAAYTRDATSRDATTGVMSHRKLFDCHDGLCASGIPGKKFRVLPDTKKFRILPDTKKFRVLSDTKKFRVLSDTKKFRVLPDTTR